GAAQGPVRVERRVHRAFITRHTALQIQREGKDTVRNVIGNVRYKRVRVRLGAECRTVAVLERGVDHADVEQQALRLGAAVGDLSVDVPTAIHDVNSRGSDERRIQRRSVAVRSGSRVRITRSVDGQQQPQDGSEYSHYAPHRYPDMRVRASLVFARPLPS